MRNHMFPALVALVCITIMSGLVRAEDPSVLPIDTSPAVEFSADPCGDERADFDIREEIRKARDFLKDSKSGYTTTTERTTVPTRGKKGKRGKRIIVSTKIEPAFLLAVEDLETRELHLVRFANGRCETEGFDVVRARKNGVASRFQVRFPEHAAVLALRTMVHGEGNGYKEVVYTPYSPEIDTPEVREDGLNYLKRQIESARADLEGKNVRLKGFQGIREDVAPTELSLVLSIIEHIDPVRFENSLPGGEADLVNEVLTIIGANTHDAYAYSRSPAGARGLFQFIPATYDKISRKYRQAGLERDFVSGCSNHVNAAKASLLLFDSDLRALPTRYLSRLGGGVQALGRYVAAAYNCGGKRVAKSMKEGSHVGWIHHLPGETKTYLKKFDAVWDMRQSLIR